MTVSAICGAGNTTGLVVGTDEACYCPIDKHWSESQQKCVSTADRWHMTEAKQCAADPPKGNPIFPLLGRKRQVERLGFSIGREEASLVFDNLRELPATVGSPALNGSDPKVMLRPPPALPAPWATTLHKALLLNPDGGVQAYRGAGRWVGFKRTSGAYVSDPGVDDSMAAVGAQWQYTDRTANSLEVYDNRGVLQSIRYADGGRLDYTYSTNATPRSQAPGQGYLLTITDDRSRSVRFDYDDQGRIYQVTTPSSDVISLTYNATNNLQKIRWPDGFVREFVYERPDLPWALTGIIDEARARHAVFTYDAQGRATGTELKSDANTSVNRYVVTYIDQPAWAVVEDYQAPILYRDFYFRGASQLTLVLPTGTSSTMAGTSVAGISRLVAQDQAAGSGCGPSTSSMDYDARGNPKRIDDFNGHRTCYAYDGYNRETVRVEGLPQSASCDSVLQPGATLPAGTRKVTTTWHPGWRLPLQVSEPGRRTTYVYNNLGDPFNNNAILVCAPSAPALPDQSRIAPLCKQVEQATTDLTGSEGLGARVDPDVQPRVRTWTYNDRGQVLTAKGPRTDVDDTVRYTYYADTTADHTLGDLNTVTQPLLPPTIYLQYNRAGQVLQSTDPNGVLTVNAYDERQRLRYSTVGGQTTEYQYWPTGLLKKTITPDGAWVYYEYDDAHRLRTVSDHLGNSITYTLDALGNRTAEEVKDPANVLRRALGRGIDALGRVQQVTGRE